MGPISPDSISGQTRSRSADMITAFAATGLARSVEPITRSRFIINSPSEISALAPAHQADQHQPTVDGETSDVVVEIAGTHRIEDDVEAVAIGPALNVIDEAP